jgi:hypothetical protein
LCDKASLSEFDSDQGSSNFSFKLTQIPTTTPSESAARDAKIVLLG